MTLRHPRLVHALMALRPGSRTNANPALADFIVEDDGSGPRLVEGSMEDPPTQAEVDALTDEHLDAAQASKAATTEQKLASIGLTVKDLKEILK